MPLSSYQYIFFNKLFEQEYYSKSSHLEIGCFDGTGIKSLAENFPNKSFICIDPFIEDGNTVEHSNYNINDKMQNIKNICLENFKNLNNIELYELTTQDFINKLLKKELDYKKLENIKTINIDGSHHFDDIIVDIDLSIYLLKGKIGCIHFDDCFNIHDVTKAILKYFMFNRINNVLNIVETGPDSVIFNVDFTK
jgi:Putative methyltransferase